MPEEETKKDLKKDDLSFIDEEIEDVNETVKRYFWKYVKMKQGISKFAFWAVLVAIGIIIAALISSEGAMLHGWANFITAILIMAIITSPVFMLALGSIKNRYRGELKDKLYSRFMREFAERNGYEYRGSGTVEKEIGAIFDYPNAPKRVLDVVEGEFLNTLARIFYYTHRFPDSRYNGVFYTVFSCSLPVKLPRMYLDAHGKIENGQKAFKSKATSHIVQSLEHITLESNEFESKFKLRATAGHHVLALQVFTPDLMVKLLDMPDRFDIELVEDKLYIYERGWVSTKRELDEMFEIAKELSENIKHATSRMRV